MHEVHLCCASKLDYEVSPSLKLSKQLSCAFSRCIISSPGCNPETLNGLFQTNKVSALILSKNNRVKNLIWYSANKAMAFLFENLYPALNLLTKSYCKREFHVYNFRYFYI